MSRSFPTVARHTAGPECFHCHAHLGDRPVIDTGYPDHHGRFRKTCPTCGYHTYYDLTKETPMQPMRTILLGAEGHAELGDDENGGWNVPWVRDATPDECEAFKEFHSWTDAQYDRWSLDGMNRPYWLVTVTADAPAAVLTQVARHSRVKRFEW